MFRELKQDLINQIGPADGTGDWTTSDAVVKAILHAIKDEMFGGSADKMKPGYLDRNSFAFRTAEGKPGKVSRIVNKIINVYEKHPLAKKRKLKGAELFNQFIMPEIAGIRKKVSADHIFRELKQDLIGQIGPEKNKTGRDAWTRSDAVVKRILNAIKDEMCGGDANGMKSFKLKTFQFLTDEGNPGLIANIVDTIIRKYEQHPVAIRHGFKGMVLYNRFILPVVAEIHKDEKEEAKADHTFKELREDLIDNIGPEDGKAGRVAWERSDAAVKAILVAIKDEMCGGDVNNMTALVRKKYQFMTRDGMPGKKANIVETIIMKYADHPDAKGTGLKGDDLLTMFILPKIAGIQKAVNADHTFNELKQELIEQIGPEKGKDGTEDWSRSDVVVRKILHAIKDEACGGDANEMTNIDSMSFRFRTSDGQPGRTARIVKRIIKIYADHPNVRSKGLKGMDLFDKFILPEIGGIREKDNKKVKVSLVFKDLQEDLIDQIGPEDGKEGKDAWVRSDAAVKRILNAIWNELCNGNANKMTQLAGKKFQFVTADGRPGRTANILLPIMRVYANHPDVAGRGLRRTDLIDQFVLPEIAGIHKETKADHTFKVLKQELIGQIGPENGKTGKDAWKRSDAAVKEILNAIKDEVYNGDANKMTTGRLNARYQFIASDGTPGKAACVLAKIIRTYADYPDVRVKKMKMGDLFYQFLLPEIAGIHRDVTAEYTFKELKQDLIDQIGPEEGKAGMDAWVRSDVAIKQILNAIKDEMCNGDANKMDNLWHKKIRFKAIDGTPGRTCDVVALIVRRYEKHPVAISKKLKGTALLYQFILPQIAHITVLKKEKEKEKEIKDISHTFKNLNQDLIDQIGPVKGEAGTVDWSRSDAAVRVIVHAIKDELFGGDPGAMINMSSMKFQFRASDGTPGKTACIVPMIIRAYENHPDVKSRGLKGFKVLYQFILPEIAGIQREVIVDHAFKALKQDLIDQIGPEEGKTGAKAWVRSDAVVKKIITAIKDEFCGGDANRIVGLMYAKIQFHTVDDKPGRITTLAETVVNAYEKHPAVLEHRLQVVDVLDQFIIPEIAGIQREAGADHVFKELKQDLIDQIGPEEGRTGADAWARSDAVIAKIMHAIMDEMCGGDANAMSNFWGKKFQFRTAYGKPGKVINIVVKIIKAYAGHPKAEEYELKGADLLDQFILPEIAGIRKEVKANHTFKELKQDLIYQIGPEKGKTGIDAWVRSDAAVKRILCAIKDEVCGGDANLMVNLRMRRYQFLRADGNPGKTTNIVETIIKKYGQHPDAKGKELKGSDLFDLFILPEIAGIHKDVMADYTFNELKQDLIDQIGPEEGKSGIDAWVRSDATVKKILHAIRDEMFGGDADKMIGLINKHFRFKTMDGKPGRTVCIVQMIVRKYASHPNVKGMSFNWGDLFNRFILSEIAGISKEVRADHTFKELKQNLIDELGPEADRTGKDAWARSDAAVKRILLAIRDEACGGDVNKMIGLGHRKYRFLTEDGRPGRSVYIYQMILGKYANHPDVKQKGLKGVVLFNQFILPEIAGIYMGAAMDENAAEQYVLKRKNDILDLILLFPDDEVMLNEAMAIFAPHIDELMRKKLVCTFAALGLGKGQTIFGEPRKVFKNGVERQKELIAVMMRRREMAKEFLTDEAKLNRLKELFLRWNAKNAQRDIDGVMRDQGQAFEEALAELQKAGGDREQKELIKRIREQVAAHYAQVRSFKVNGLETKMLEYERRGAQFLAGHDKAILADEQGMRKTFQAVAAAEKLNLKRVLIVTPNRVKRTWASIIKDFTGRKDKEVCIVDSDELKEAEKDAKMFDALAKRMGKARYLIVNYEFLRGRSEKEIGSSDFLVGDLNAQLLCNSLKDNKKADIIILEKLGLKTEQLSTVSEEAFIAAFNDVLRMRDFPERVTTDELKSLLSDDMQLLLDSHLRDANAVTDQELKDLNKSLLQAIYPQEIRKSQEIKDLFPGIELAIIDEVQKADSPSDTVQQAAAIRQIKPQRRWLLSGTPYHDKPEHLYSLLSYLDQYEGSFEKFKTDFIVGRGEVKIGGLVVLKQKLAKVMLRRRQSEVFAEYDEKLHGDGKTPWRPKRVDIEPQKEGMYDLSEEQVEIIKSMIDDFKGWAERYNALRTTKEDEKLDIEGLNPMVQLEMILQAMADPKMVGGKGESPLIGRLADAVVARVKAGKKVLIFAKHRWMVERLQEAIDERLKKEKLGKAEKMYGGVSEDAQESHKIAFNKEESNLKVLVAGIDSGGTGISLTGADTVMFAELPFTYSELYQAEYRPLRIGGGKKEVEYVTWLGKYPPGTVEKMKDDEFLKKVFSAPSAAEILKQIIDGKGMIYRFLMDDLGNNEMESELRRGLAGNYPWLGVGREMMAWEPLRELAQGDKRIQEALNDVAYLYQESGLKGKGLVEIVKDINRAAEQDEERSPFEAGDLAIPAKLDSHPDAGLWRMSLQGLEASLAAIYEENTTLAREAVYWEGELSDFEGFLLLPLTLVSWRAGDGGKEALRKILREMMTIEDVNERDMEIGRLYAALAHLSAHGEEASAFLDANAALLEGMKGRDALLAIEKLMVVSYAQKDVFAKLCEREYADAGAMAREIDVAYRDALKNEFKVAPTEEMEDESRPDRINWMYGLMQVMKDCEYKVEVKLLKAAITESLKGTYGGRRARGWDRTSMGEEAFWDAWNKPYYEQWGKSYTMKAYETANIDHVRWVAQGHESVNVWGRSIGKLRGIASVLTDRNQRLMLLVDGDEHTLAGAALVRVRTTADGRSAIHVSRPAVPFAGMLESELVSIVKVKARDVPGCDLLTCDPTMLKEEKTGAEVKLSPMADAAGEMVSGKWRTAESEFSHKGKVVWERGDIALEIYGQVADAGRFAELMKEEGGKWRGRRGRGIPLSILARVIRNGDEAALNRLVDGAEAARTKIREAKDHPNRAAALAMVDRVVMASRLALERCQCERMVKAKRVSRSVLIGMEMTLDAIANGMEALSEGALAPLPKPLGDEIQRIKENTRTMGDAA